MADVSYNSIDEFYITMCLFCIFDRVYSMFDTCVSHHLWYVLLQLVQYRRFDNLTTRVGFSMGEILVSSFQKTEFLLHMLMIFGMIVRKREYIEEVFFMNNPSYEQSILFVSMPGVNNSTLYVQIKIHE